MLKKGEWVWVDSDIGVPIGARVKVTPSGQRLLVDDDGEERALSEEQEASLRIMHPTSVEGVDDMIKLGDMTEAGLLRNLLLRHKKGIIYTYTGSVLVAVNPYQDYPLYSEDQVKRYHGCKLGELPPHIFAIAESCYFNMTRNLRSQCCIISGESGAGKTESTKLILQYLAAVSGQISEQISEQRVEQQILESNPILEAFGNAKTIHNDNSSRFGKYLEIFFSKDGVIEGACVEQYLLEKSRVCHQAPDERNYHMFYCMLTGLTTEEKKSLGLGDAKDYKCLTKGGRIICDTRDDAKDYKRIRSAMKILTFPESQCQEIFKLLAAILHLGNISFEATTQNNLETCDISKSEHFNMAATLLEVQTSSLKNSLTHRSFMTNTERVIKPLSSEQAINCRDAFIKAIYNKLFIWIVGKINSVIYKKLNSSAKSSYLSIGLLDIFGFENFGTNSFEQLCINFANEKLQQFFVRHIFKLEQEDYLKEGVMWNNVKFNDNQDILDLLAGRACNLLALIDEESNFPKGSDVTMLNKMNKQHNGNTTYIASKNEYDTDFGIRHFAGVVLYDSKGFLEKNRDGISSDIIKMVEQSTNKLLHQVFESELSTNGVKLTSNKKIIMTPKSSLRNQNDKRKQVPTLSGQFRQSLDSLMKALYACQPFFIRCFKPNNSKKSEMFDRQLCMRQLRYSGMMDTIRIRNLGFPIRHTFEEFLRRYRVLLKTTVCDPKTETTAACCEAICKTVIKGQDEWKVGKKKIFLKDAHDAVLERLREQELSRTAFVIQRVVRGYKDRKSFLKKRGAAVVLQKHWRGCRGRKEHRQLKHGYERLASKVRSRRLHAQFQRQQAAALTIQTQVRGFQQRKTWRRKREAAILLQAHTRGLLARRVAQKMKDDAIALHLEQQEHERITQELQRSLEELVANAQPALEPEPEPEPEPELKQKQKQKQKPVIEQVLEDSLVDLRPPPAARAMQRKSSDADEFEFATKGGWSVPLETTSLGSASPCPSLAEDESDHEAPPAPAVEAVERRAPESGTPKLRRLLEPVSEPVSEPMAENSIEVTRQDLEIIAAMSTDSTPSLEEEEEGDDFDGAGEFSFLKFGTQHFQGHANHTHIAHRLKEPLLSHDDEGDTLACLTVWWIILRFMGDIPEPKAQDSTSQASSTISQRVPIRSGRRLSSLVGLDQKILRKKMKLGGSRKASTIPEEPEDVTEHEDVLIGEGPTLHRPLTPLEKLHIIAGYALSRQNIRDEIYCQICKQLVGNRNRRSRMQGWTLLSICLGIFPPTDLFMKYLETFVRRGPSGYGAYCTQLLHRVVTNGERKELPCWVELKAARSKQPIDVAVTLMDDSTVSVQLDSASTSGEVCQAVADKTGLKDTYGFSLYISLYEKIWSLGSCEKHVLDAVSQCEQEMRRQGKEEKDAPWSLSVRKELFTPWHDCSLDPNSTHLIYRQVIKGMKSEYVSEKEDEYVQLAAKHYYIQYGSAHSTDNVRKVVEECIATPLIENKSMTKWIELISSAHLQGDYISGGRSKESVKGELVDSARQNWPLHFSKFYDVTMTSGPPLPKNRFVAAVNWSGIVFMEGKERRLLDLPYLEVNAIHRVSEQLVGVDTVRGNYVLRCEEAADMASLMESTLDGLRLHSVYALAQQDTGKADDPTLLVCKRGDLLLAEKDKDYSPEDACIRATNLRTSCNGTIYKDALQFLPTLTKPNEEIMELLSPGQRKSTAAQAAVPREETVAPVSIKEFALEYFSLETRPGAKGISKKKLWSCSREPLRQPLLKSLLSNSDLSYLACNASIAILKYMGDYPIKQTRSHTELTDQIFGPATQYEALQDEVYCQIMRQMTNNSNRLSMERGWQLMWLCSGLFPPSRNLMRHTHRFLESRPRDPLAVICLQRLQDMYSKKPRKLPPHLVEVEAIQQNSTLIFHKVHFPNDTDEIYEVTSTTTITDLCSIIASQLHLSSHEGYGLYMKTPTKIISLDEDEYFFDSLKQTSDISKKAKRAKEGNQPILPYLVILKRKLWFNVSPGKDQIADLMFHFPQELPKYLRGYHNCSKEDMISLGGLLFRCIVDSDRTQFVMIPRMLGDLIPDDQIKIMSADEWKKHIISSYNKQSGITVQEAKIAFLKAVSSWPTFGCAFYEVKQSCESSYPNTVLIAINKQGVSLIDPRDKELLVMHPFSRITDYQSKGNIFQMTIGTILKGFVFACETPQAHTMEDLLRSYVSMYERQRQAFRPRNNMLS